jgi:hypothetical protein
MVGQSIVPVYDCLTGQFESFPSSAADIDDPMVCQVHGHLGWNGEDRRLPMTPVGIALTGCRVCEEVGVPLFRTVS